ncbi:hypothetical protein PtA15_3A278 [Puccinia triticina]|uniref:Uncharacterized protein n=1 Tax=Puccinia triticina TaxID=208348 RepID=A0ABY7CCG0_9BASI|nr:uncharacterized protein PtA15_3A278 [Puccinia triticina]WAQ82913.1 hypothetical protein PtA15_3A278 [Puccinia triticina]
MLYTYKKEVPHAPAVTNTSVPPVSSAPIHDPANPDTQLERAGGRVRVLVVAGPAKGSEDAQPTNTWSPGNAKRLWQQAPTVQSHRHCLQSTDKIIIIIALPRLLTNSSRGRKPAGVSGDGYAHLNPGS